MIINIPFELGETIYVLKNIEYLADRRWIPPDYSLGGDEDGPFDRGHYEDIYDTELKIIKGKFRLELLYKYKIDEIYKTYEDAYWALLNKEAADKDV